MDFYCFLCKEEFASSKGAINHLKNIHFMIDNTDQIKCVVKNCTKMYLTFKGLGTHLKTFDHQNVSERIFLHSLKKQNKNINFLNYLDSSN